MKLTLLLLALILLAGCTRNESGRSSNSTAPANQTEATKAEKPATPRTVTVADPSAPPVEFTFLGITPDKENIAYRFKINTAKPIEEVHLVLKEYAL